jgi:hypothetical protein
MDNEQRAPGGAGDGGKPQKYAVYCGDGLYLRSLARDESGRVSIGRDQARAYARHAAIQALHAVRKRGRSAWIVPHPGKMARAGVPA